MKVCIVTTAFPRWPQDNRGTFILEAARAVQAQGAQVRVIAMHSPGTKTREVMDSIEVIRPPYLWPERLEVLQKEGGGLPIMWRKSRLARCEILPFFMAHTLAIMRFARDCDIIHANWTLSAAAAWTGQFYHRRPILVTLQGSDIYQATQLPLVSRFTAMVLKRSSRVLAISKSLAEATIALGISPSQVEVVSDGVDTDKFCPSGEERKSFIVFVGSLIERKGLRHLIRAMSQVRREFPECRLVIIGEGPQQAELNSLADSLGIADNVSFVGPQTPVQISQWMQQARLFVLPSVEEGLGVVLLEALASGTPCVATSVGGIPDVVSPEVGILVPPAEPDALAEAIIALWRDRQRWEMASRRARERAVERFSWKSIACHLVELYQAVIDSKKSEYRLQ